MLELIVMLIKINGQKLKELRGNRSLGKIRKLADSAFSDVALYKWEQGLMQPKEDNIKVLLRIYDCRLEDIAEPLALN